MTGLHTGHAWIRGNGAGGRAAPAEDVTIAEVLRARGYRTALVGKWGLGQPGTTGMPDKQGFDHAFGFLDQRHAHRQFTDHSVAQRRAGRRRRRARLRRRPVHEEAAAFIERDDPRPFFLYLNYTVPHAELRAPEDAIAPFAASSRRSRSRTPRPTPSRPARAPDAAVARLSIAAGAARRVRRDDHADGPRHRPARRICCARAASTAAP